LAEPAIKRLGVFLADLTQDKPPDQIHQEVLVRLRDPDQDLDHRLAGIYLHVKDFVPIWTAIRNGVSLPASSWETVVLPVVVHFSAPHNLKPHLEAATSLFLTARGNREIEDDPTPAPVYEPEPLSLLDSVFDHDVDNAHAPDPMPQPAIAAVKARTRRRWVPQAAAVAIVALAAVAIWTRSGAEKPSRIDFSALPERPRVAVPSTEPSASPSAEPLPSGSPIPALSPPAPGAPQMPGQTARIPGAPTDLSYSNVGQVSVTLSWRAPADATNVAYYKIFQGGTVIGQTTATTDEAVNLAPGTTYLFFVRAYNQAGEESPPSNSLSVTTARPPLVFDVPSSVAFGASFGVGGSGWPCSDVTIYIEGIAVAIGKVDEFTSFDVPIDVHDRHGGLPGWVDTLDGGEMQLYPQSWMMSASCIGGPSKSAPLAVVGTPMAEPSGAARYESSGH
jgi:hypothetical protein